MARTSTKRSGRTRSTRGPATGRDENRLIRLAIVIFWALVWLLSFADTVGGMAAGVWLNGNRLEHFMERYAQLGVADPVVSSATLIVIGAAELVAFSLFGLAFLSYFRGERDYERYYFYLGIIVSLAILTLFTVGNQLFGNQAKLLEHSLYWIAAVISWFLYTRLTPTSAKRTK